MMASVSTKLQIPCTLLSQSKQSSKLSKYNTGNLMNLIPPSNFRSFWSWSRKSKKKSKQRCSTTCGKELPENLKPYNPQCPSKCLQIENCKDNETAKRKLTNCRDVETAAKTNKLESHFTKYFHQSSVKKKSIDPCTCRVINHEKSISRQQDPRLRDPRYEMTDGDVFIFTECRRTRNTSTRELLPKPPPSYKMPKAVFTQKFIKQMEITPNNCRTAWPFEVNCGDQSSKCSILKKTPSLPFEELRPPERQRPTYSCKDGVRSEVVPKPPNSNSYCCGALKLNSHQQKNTASPLEIDGTNHSIELSQEIHSSREKSRFEQLKKLTRAKESSSCCSASFINTAEETNRSLQICR